MRVLPIARVFKQQSLPLVSWQRARINFPRADAAGRSQRPVREECAGQSHGNGEINSRFLRDCRFITNAAALYFAGVGGEESVQAASHLERHVAVGITLIRN